MDSKLLAIIAAVAVVAVAAVGAVVLLGNGNGGNGGGGDTLQVVTESVTTSDITVDSASFIEKLDKFDGSSGSKVYSIESSSDDKGSLSLTIGKDAVSAASGKSVSLQVKSAAGAMTLSPEALKTLADGTADGVNVVLTISSVDSSGKTALSAGIADAVGDAPVFSISNSAGVHALNGKIAVTFPYEASDSDSVRVYYLDTSSDKLEEVAVKSYDSEAHMVTAELDHMSYFAVSEKALSIPEDPYGIHKSRYTLLDGNPAAGQVYTSYFSGSGYSTADVYTVDSIFGGSVRGSLVSTSKIGEYQVSGYGFSDFSPANLFDYVAPHTISGPEVTYNEGVALIEGTAVTDGATLKFEGVTVLNEGNLYTLGGKFTVTYASDSCIVRTFSSLVITYSNDAVSSVQGGLATDSRISGQPAVVQEFDLRTSGEEVQAKGSIKVSDTFKTDSANFLSYVAVPYQEPSTGISVTESTERIGDVTAAVYTWNGTSSGGDDPAVYSGLKHYVYKGYLLQTRGTVDGAQVLTVLTVTGPSGGDEPEVINPDYDYTMLDSDDFLRVGLSIHEETELGGSSTVSDNLVDLLNVDNDMYGVVGFSSLDSGTFVEAGDYLDVLYPSSKLDGLYDCSDAEEYDGLEVTVDGDTRTVNGTVTVDNVEYTFQNYSVTIDGSTYTFSGTKAVDDYGVNASTYEAFSVTCGEIDEKIESATGKMSLSERGVPGRQSDEVREFKTVDGTIMIKSTESRCSYGNGSASHFLTYHKLAGIDSSKLESTGTTARVGNVTADVYSYTGGVYCGIVEYETSDLNVCVYRGVMIYADGYAGDERLTGYMAFDYPETLNHGSLYAALISDYNLEEGQRFDFTHSFPNGDLTFTSAITEVDGDYITFTSSEVETLEEFSKSVYDLDDFEPEYMYLEPEYVPEAETVKIVYGDDGSFTVNGTYVEGNDEYSFKEYRVSNDGNVYTISGESTYAGSTLEETWVYDGFTVTVNGGNVTDMSGRVTITILTPLGSTTRDCEFDTVGGVLMWKGVFTYDTDNEVHRENIYGHLLPPFTIPFLDDDHEKSYAFVGDIVAEVRTYSGTYTYLGGEHTLEDFKVYLFADAVIYVDGLEDGQRHSASLFIREGVINPGSKYSVLESEDSIRKGQAYGFEDSSNYREYSGTYTVESVADGTVTYSLDSHLATHNSGSFAPFYPAANTEYTGYVGFDYVGFTGLEGFSVTKNGDTTSITGDSIPDGVKVSYDVSVSLSGSTYTINGKYTRQTESASYEKIFDELVIVWEGESITSVTGIVSVTVMETTDLGPTRVVTVNEYKSGLNALFIATDVFSQIGGTVPVGDAFDLFVSPYMSVPSEECDGTYVYAGDTKAYLRTYDGAVTINGMKRDVEDLKVYTVNGFIVTCEGTVDGLPYSYELTVAE